MGIFILMDDGLGAECRFKRNNTLLLVNGLGGIGKTALAQAYYHQYQHAYQHQAWVFVGDGLRDSLVRQLQQPLKLSFTDDMAINERFPQLISALQHVSGRNLLVLDNADHNQALINVKSHLQSIGWHVLVTSRCEPEEYQAEMMPIDTLTPKDANALFRYYYDLQGDLAPLLKKIYYHTLLIELLAKAAKKKGLSLAQLTASLEQGIDHDDLARSIQVGQHADQKQLEKQTQLYRYILAIFEPEKMPPRQQQYLIYFSVLPAEDISLAHLSVLFAIEDQNIFEDDLDELCQAGWLNQKHDKTGLFYKMHALLQDVVFKKLVDAEPEGEQKCQPLIIQLQHLLQLPLMQAVDFTAYAEHVSKQLTLADIELALLNAYLSDVYKELGFLELALEKIKLASQQFKQIDDKENLAISYSRLGSIHQALGQVDKALELFELEMELFKELSESNPKSESLKHGLANSYLRLSLIHQALGQVDKTFEFFELNIQLTKELYESNPKSESLKNGLAIAYSKLGDIHQALGQVDKALEFFELATELFEQLYNSNQKSESLKNGLAIAYYKLGSIHQALGQMDKALEFFELYNQLREKLYESNPKSESLKNGLAIAYYQLAGIIEDKQQARHYYQQAIALWQQLYQLNGLKKYQDNIEIVRQLLAELDNT